MGRTALFFVVALAAVLNSVQASPLDLQAILKEHDEHHQNLGIGPNMEDADAKLTVVWTPIKPYTLDIGSNQVLHNNI